jgi:hypothetical protein
MSKSLMIWCQRYYLCGPSEKRVSDNDHSSGEREREIARDWKDEKVE